MSTELKKVIKKGSEARESLLKGIDAVADIVESTLGPGGMNVMAEQTFYKTMVTNDGIRVAKQAINDESLDEVERLGAQMIVDTVSEEDKEAGDGTTTTTCLTRALAHKVLKMEREGQTSISIKKKIDKEKEHVVDMIKEESTELFSLQDVANVSMEDKDHAKNVAEIFEKYGKDVDINLRFNKEGSDVVIDENNGYKFVAGFASPYFASDKNRMESIITGARVFKFDTVIDNEDEKGTPYDVISKILATYPTDPIVVIANDFSDEVVQKILFVKNKTNVDLTLVKRIQFKSAEISEEISLLTGCGDSFMDEEFDVQSGSKPVDSITITKESVTIVNEPTQEAVDEFVANVTDNQDRVNRLTKSIVTLRVGGKTYSEMNYLRHKYEDAINAVSGAMDEGVVRGGGKCLFDINDKLPEDFILKGILDKPARVIAENLGLDIKEMTIEDTIIDSAKTVRSAVEHACATAGLLVTTSTVIATKKNQNEAGDSSAFDTSELPMS